MAVSLFDLLFVLIHEDNNERQDFKITAISNKGKPDEQKLKILIMKQQENYQNIIFLRINVLDVEKQLELMKSREIMFNSIQHDVKNPLFAGSLLIQMIITKYLISKELQIDNLYSLKHYFDISLSLINGYFDFTLAQIGNLKIQPEYFLLHEPIVNIIQMMQYSAQKQSVHLTSLYNNKKTFARNDVKRLSQVLMNLINNAIKFTKNGGQVIIEVEEFLYKNLVYINVIDTGIGMNAEIMNKIGQLYTTFNNNNMNRFGTGIGLYTSIKTVGVLGPLEKIFISSVEGIGSEFSFLIYVNAHDQLIKSKIERFNNDIKQILLYLRQDEILVDQTPSFTDIYIAEEQYAILDTRITTQYHMMINNNITNHNKKRKMIILVVDDEEIIRIATINAIKQLGKQNFQFYQAKNGQVGVEIFQELNKNDSNSFIDLIFTDIQMPELDGYEMVKQINELIEKNDYKKPEIIALSSNCSDQFDQNCKALNIDQNYYKPQNAEQIRDIIRNFQKKQVNLLQNQNSQ